LKNIYKSINNHIMAFELPYAYDALEPHIDARTMEIHHSKHHNAYTTNLNAAGTDMEGKTIENILINLDMKNMPVTMAVVLQSQLILDSYDSNGGLPTGDLLAAIEATFGLLKNLKASFSKAGATQFGSGWAWLCVQKAEKLKFVVLQTKTIH
jgi:Fe-Mn family superoxide dismutase